MPAKIVGHLDADCFYVSAERVRDDFLLDIPVGVLGNQGACVIAKSYEMKRAGVKTGEPIWEAIEKCPDGVYIKRDFRWYEVLSLMMQAVLKEYSPRVAFYSIDEFFFEAFPGPGQTYQDYARTIRDAIMERVRVPVTVGIARSNTLAKLISDSIKPFGCRAVLDKESEVELMRPLPVTEIAGIAGGREARLLPWGIATCLDLANADRRLVRELLTASGEAIWWELNGDPVTAINIVRPRHKCLARGGSMGQHLSSDPNVVFAWLVRNLERLIEELEYHQVMAGKLGVQLWYRDGTYREAYAKPEAPSAGFDVLLDVARVCLRRDWVRWGTPSKMEVVAGMLTSRWSSQLGLFDGDGERQAKVAELKRRINERHGRFAIRSAATLALSGVYRDKSNNYDICDVRGKMCF